MTGEITREAAPGVSLRRVVVPVEHGGWAFLAEPVVLGLAAAPSPAGAVLALATLAAFLARQPLKLSVMDRRRGRVHPRTVLATRAFAALGLIAALALAGAVLLGGPLLLVPLALATPLAAASLGLDLGNRSRTPAAELAAPLALAAVASAIALARGWMPGPAFGLWGILAARSVPSILYVRARLRLERGERAGLAAALVAQAAGLAWAIALASSDLAPWLAVGMIGLLAARAALGLSRWRPAMTTRQLGASEAVMSTLTVLAVVLGIRLGL